MSLLDRAALEEALLRRLQLTDHPELLSRMVAEYHLPLVSIVQQLQLLDQTPPTSFIVPPSAELVNEVLQTIRLHHIKCFGREPAWWPKELQEIKL